VCTRTVSFFGMFPPSATNWFAGKAGPFEGLLPELESEDPWENHQHIADSTKSDADDGVHTVVEGEHVVHSGATLRYHENIA